MSRVIIIAVIIFITIVMSFTVMVGTFLVATTDFGVMNFDRPDDSAAEDPRCQKIYLEITSLDATGSRATIVLHSGAEEISKVKVLYPGFMAVNVFDAEQLKQSGVMTKGVGARSKPSGLTVGGRYNSGPKTSYIEIGDEIEIMPVLEDGFLCDIKDTAVAS